MEYKEIWMDVIGYEGLYEVSNLGRVKSLEKKVWNGFGMAQKKERILKLTIDKDGYLTVSLYKNGKKCLKIHRLVCLSFIPNPKNKITVNHINGIKNDNKLENLEWSTRSENEKHAYKIGLKSQKGENHIGAKLTEEQAIKIKYSHKGMMQKEIAVIYGINEVTVSFIRTGRNWKHI